MSLSASNSSLPRVPAWARFAIVIVVVGLMIWFRVHQGPAALVPIGFGVPIVLIGALRDRRLLWFTTAAFLLYVIIRVIGVHGRWWDGILLSFDMLLITAVLHVWIVVSQSLAKQNSLLDAANEDLSRREEEIARQNEELQSQTEELERQSEELRVANEDLAQREKVLEILLSLSRSLNTNLSRDQIMQRICQTLGLLVSGPSAAAAILEQNEQGMKVLCHHGFGSAGLREEVIPNEQSFARLILARGRTGYIEDLAERPDLRIPQPKEGDPMVAILATALRVRGEAVGSLEVYSRAKTGWTQEQVALLESLAGQTSISLEAAQLFESVTQERNRFQALIETVPVGIKIANTDCTEVQLNPTAAAMMNVPADIRIPIESVARYWQTFKDGKAVDPSQYQIVRATAGEEIHGEIVEIVLGNGRRIICLTHARPIRDHSGAIRGAVSILVDITAQKELQRELDMRRREAEEASMRKTRFLAAVSHDIRTPANAISLLAELIRRSASNPAASADVPELAQELHQSASSLVHLLSDVLDIARFDSDKVDLQESEFLLAELLADEQKHLQPLARQKGLEIMFNAPAEPILVRTDRIKLARVLGNLIGNAIKFTEAGTVTVQARRNGDNTVHIAIADTGIGIAAEHLAHIFDEFFQLRNPERDRAKGSGLGLTICKRLVDAMGGNIAVNSTPGKGSTFTVVLPAFAAVPFGQKI